jgi:hypothetical protein
VPLGPGIVVPRLVPLSVSHTTTPCPHSMLAEDAIKAAVKDLHEKKSKGTQQAMAATA